MAGKPHAGRCAEEGNGFFVRAIGMVARRPESPAPEETTAQAASATEGAAGTKDTADARDASDHEAPAS